MSDVAHVPTSHQPGPHARFTTAEFRRMSRAGAFDDMKMELVGGELVRRPLPYSHHGRMQAQVASSLAGSVPRKMALCTAGLDLGNNSVFAFDAAVLGCPVDEAGCFPRICSSSSESVTAA